jgi:hypothetical protein
MELVPVELSLPASGLRALRLQVSELQALALQE